jgi:hypothetical protein
MTNATLVNKYLTRTNVTSEHREVKLLSRLQVRHTGEGSELREIGASPYST